MQPGYGVPADMHSQQNQPSMANNDSSVFPISNAFQNLSYHYHQQKHQDHHQQQQMLLQHQQQHSIPITQLLFEHQQPHFRPTFQQHRLHPHQPQSFLPMKFKLGVDQNRSSSNEQVAAADFLNANIGPSVMQQPHFWHPQEDSASIKQPFWKQPSGASNNKHECENEEQEAVQGNSKNRAAMFDELEIIYSLAKFAEANQTGSGSALTGENSPKNVNNLSMPFSAPQGQNPVLPAGAAITGDGSENSIGEEASLRKRTQKSISKRKIKEKFSSMTGFFENLVKQVMDHQEMLHRKFLQVLNRMDVERTEREEAWRKQEAAKYNREAISRAHEQALASSREAQIVSCIEKITGQTIDLPARKTPLLLQPEISEQPTKELTPANMSTNINNRWPKAEVEALIQVRTSIEAKFQEPGLKGLLWEEVSSLMSSMGYQRSAKRCKEKWENINKYFRKAKDSTKKRSQQSKTCSYFNQLNQIYSRTLIDSPSSNTCNSMPSLSSSEVEKQQGYSELLEASIAGKDIDTSANYPSSKKMKLNEISGAARLDFDGSTNDMVEQGSQEEKYKEEHHKDGYNMDGDEEDQGGSIDDEQEMGH